MTKSQDYEHMANLIKMDTDIISQMVDNDHFFEKLINYLNIFNQYILGLRVGYVSHEFNI